MFKYTFDYRLSMLISILFIKKRVYFSSLSHLLFIFRFRHNTRYFWGNCFKNAKFCIITHSILLWIDDCYDLTLFAQSSSFFSVTNVMRTSRATLQIFLAIGFLQNLIVSNNSVRGISMRQINSFHFCIVAKRNKLHHVK